MISAISGEVLRLVGARGFELEAFWRRLEKGVSELHPDPRPVRSLRYPGMSTSLDSIQHEYLISYPLNRHFPIRGDQKGKGTRAAV